MNSDLSYFKNGRGIRANGTSDWAELGPGGSPCWYAPRTCTKQALTLGFWLKIYTISSSLWVADGILSTLKATSTSIISSKKSEGFDVYLYSGEISLKVRTASPDRVFTMNSNIIPTSTWVYCTWVWRLNGNPYHIIYYANGREVKTSDRSNRITSSTLTAGNLVFGRVFANQDAHYSNVEIDDLTIITQALNSSEVLAIYTLHN